ncbi:MAG: SAM-dependent methyltransferase [Oscillatoriales cyanobacterium CG2_30_44_21]|nr:MAG: SAM-dependent methyltransferase [Oscillatoriales cyanobacterium CG2_30_44_21]
MSWIEISLNTNHEAVDWVCTLLANEISQDDFQIGKYVGDAEQSRENWAFTILIYLPHDSQIHQKVEAIATILKPLHRTNLTSELQTFVLDSKPALKNDFSQVRHIGDRFVIVKDDLDYAPSHDQEIILHLKNSLAFGSGLHPATILSMQLLERHVQPASQALDLGSGSGLLSLAIAKLGAMVLAIDNDPVAVAATEDAVQRNQVAELVKVQLASLGSASQLGHWMGGEGVGQVTAIAAAGQFDLIAANIFARVHISLAVEFAAALRANSGILITAGYTCDRADDVVAAMVAVGLCECDRLQLDEWVAIAFCLLKK